MAKGHDDTGYSGGILNSDPFLHATNPEGFGYGKKLPSMPGSEMNQARQAAAERALNPMANPMPAIDKAMTPPTDNSLWAPGGPMYGKGRMPDRPELPEGETAAPEPKGTFQYGAEGDPYDYQLNPDASVTIKTGPTGEGATLKEGAAYQAIMAQIASGQLKPKNPEQKRSLTGELPEDQMARVPPEQRQSMGWEDPRTELARLDAARK